MTPYELNCVREESRELHNQYLAEYYDDGLADGWSGEPPYYPDNNSYMEGWHQGSILKEVGQKAREEFGLSETNTEEF